MLNYRDHFSSSVFLIVHCGPTIFLFIAQEYYWVIKHVKKKTGARKFQDTKQSPTQGKNQFYTARFHFITTWIVLHRNMARVSSLLGPGRTWLCATYRDDRKLLA